MDPNERLQYPLPEEELLHEIQKVRIFGNLKWKFDMKENQVKEVKLGKKLRKNLVVMDQIKVQSKCR